MEELPALLAALYAGLVIGALYDALRPLRLFSQGRLWNGLLDVLYYGLVLCVAAFALFYINGGAPRVYLLLGICLGAYAYARLVSRFLVAVADLIKKTVAKLRRMD